MVYNNCVAKPRNPEALTTSREVFWSDVDKISLYKRKVKRFDNQIATVYESDKQVIHRMVEFFAQHNKPENEVPVATYPRTLLTPTEKTVV